MLLVRLVRHLSRGLDVARARGRESHCEIRRVLGRTVAGRESDLTDQRIEKLLLTPGFEVLVGEKWTKVKRIEKPLLYYGDATRENDRGSVWAWGEKGRPVDRLLNGLV